MIKEVLQIIQLVKGQQTACAGRSDRPKRRNIGRIQPIQDRRLTRIEERTVIKLDKDTWSYFVGQVCGKVKLLYPDSYGFRKDYKNAPERILIER